MEIIVINVLNWFYTFKYFCFFVCKNHNMRTIILIADMLITKTFLSNIFLAVFVFLIMYMKTIADNKSS